MNTQNYEIRTAEEIAALKRGWKADPCWDIEDTEGFEAHRDELTAYHLECRAQWDKAREDSYLETAAKAGCPGNKQLGEYIEYLESRIARLGKEIKKLKYGDDWNDIDL